jgi:hypothetical protein
VPVRTYVVAKDKAEAERAFIAGQACALDLYEAIHVRSVAEEEAGSPRFIFAVDVYVQQCEDLKE